MSRTASLQFHLFTREEAIAYLARCSYGAEAFGDRIAAWRTLEPRTTAEERAAVRAYNDANGCDERGRPTWWRDRGEA